jgi:hypothetical protein
MLNIFASMLGLANVVAALAYIALVVPAELLGKLLMMPVNLLAGALMDHACEIANI